MRFSIKTVFKNGAVLIAALLLSGCLYSYEDIFSGQTGPAFLGTSQKLRIVEYTRAGEPKLYGTRKLANTSGFIKHSRGSEYRNSMFCGGFREGFTFADGRNYELRHLTRLTMWEWTSENWYLVEVEVPKNKDECRKHYISYYGWLQKDGEIYHLFVPPEVTKEIQYQLEDTFSDSPEPRFQKGALDDHREARFAFGQLFGSAVYAASFRVFDLETRAERREFESITGESQ